MTGSTRRFRLGTVLRLARSDEREAQTAAVRADQEAERADTAVTEARARLDDPAGAPVMSVAELHRRRQLAELRAQDAIGAERRREELLADALAARSEWLAAVRRRRSLEGLEDRHIATRAAIAARASQKALDDLASIRRSRGAR